MKTVEILGANRFESYTKTRDGSRAIIIQDGQILLSHEKISGWWLIPGGGMEEGETKRGSYQREYMALQKYINKDINDRLDRRMI